MGIIPIVEGQGEVDAVPVLLRRILAEVEIYDLEIARPFRVKRNRVVREGELERAIHQALRDRATASSLILILDADDDCPRELGPQLLARCRAATEVPVAVVLASREFEAWYLGAKESLRGTRGIRADAIAPSAPEEIRDAKGRLSANMENRRYLEVDDQAALASRVDLSLARERCPSFDKLVRDVQRLATSIRSDEPP